MVSYSVTSAIVLSLPPRELGVISRPIDYCTLTDSWPNHQQTNKAYHRWGYCRFWYISPFAARSAEKYKSLLHSNNRGRRRCSLGCCLATDPSSLNRITPQNNPPPPHSPSDFVLGGSPSIYQNKLPGGFPIRLIRQQYCILHPTLVLIAALAVEEMWCTWQTVAYWISNTAVGRFDW